MDGTNHSRGSTIQSLSPDKREGLEYELRPEALASIAREENAEASTNTTHAAVSPKTGKPVRNRTQPERLSMAPVEPKPKKKALLLLLAERWVVFGLKI